MVNLFWIRFRSMVEVILAISLNHPQIIHKTISSLISMKYEVAAKHFLAMLTGGLIPVAAKVRRVTHSISWLTRAHQTMSCYLRSYYVLYTTFSYRILAFMYSEMSIFLVPLYLILSVFTESLRWYSQQQWSKTVRELGRFILWWWQFHFGRGKYIRQFVLCFVVYKIWKTV